MSFTPNQNSDISVSVKADDLIGEMSKFGHVAELSPSLSSSTLLCVLAPCLLSKHLCVVKYYVCCD